MRTDWKLTAGTLIAAGALALPASASAAVTLATPLPGCIAVQKAFGGNVSLPVSVTGGGAGDEYSATAILPNNQGSQGDALGNFDANGNVSFTLTGLYPLSEPAAVAGVPESIEVKDFAPDTGAYTTTTVGTVLVSDVTAEVGLEPIAKQKPRVIAVSGTQFANQTMYAFITNKTGSKLLKRYALGRSNVCGYASHKEALNFASGSYRLYINPGDKLNRKTALSKSFSIALGDVDA